MRARRPVVLARNRISAIMSLLSRRALHALPTESIGRRRESGSGKSPICPRPARAGRTTGARREHSARGQLPRHRGGGALQPAVAVREELSVRLAEIRELPLGCPSVDDPVARALSIAERLPPARLAGWVEARLQRREALEALAVEHLLERRLVNVPKLPLALDEEVARVAVSVMFQHDIAARWRQLAQLGLAGDQHLEQIVEVTDAHLAEADLHPGVKQFVEEAAVLLGRNRVCAEGAGTSSAGIVAAGRLDAGNELQVLDTQLAVVAQQLPRPVHVGGRDDTENVELHPKAAQQLERLQHLLVLAAALSVEAIAVVPFGRTIQAQPDQKAIVVEELGPGFVQERAVGLERVGEAPGCVGSEHRLRAGRPERSLNDLLEPGQAR